MSLIRLLAVALILSLAGCAQMEERDLTGSEAAYGYGGENDNLYNLSSGAPQKSPRVTQTDYGLWTRLAQNFTMQTVDNERIDAQVFFYQSRTDQLHTITQRAEPYLFFVVEQLRERGMPLELALLPIVESSYKPEATSRSQAAGIWQFIPSTGTHYGLKQNWWYDGRRDIQASTNAALDYLQNLNRMFNGDWALSLAAYNAGEGTVSRAIQKAEAKGEPTDYWSLDLPEETRYYVPRLLALVRIFHDPEANGLTPHPVKDAPMLTSFSFDKPLDLGKVATALNMSEADLYKLNPGFKRGVNGHGQDVVSLLLPHDKAEQLRQQNLESFCVTLAPPRRVTLKKNESLASLAKRYGVGVAEIREINPPLGKTLKRGQTLSIPSNRMAIGQPSAQIAANEPDDAADPLKLPAKERYAVNTKRIHAVSAGDSLFNVSRKYGVKPADLASWNNLNAKSALKPGQKLTVYCELPENKTTASAGAKNAPTQDSATAKTYTVKKGDTLHSIAQRFKISMAQLREWNHLKGGAHLSAGQTLIVAASEKKPARNS
ncbi:MAG: LysM peptidoglycan-binding domain-containing protein [Pseudomonadota bacterium]